MGIEIKFFASLSETLGMKTTTIDAGTATTVREAWIIATNNMDYPANTLCAINMAYAQPDNNIKDGDEVAFFPPVTGG